MFALKFDDIDFRAGTVRVDESSDQRSKGKIGPRKNVAAYRTVLLRDRKGKEALRILKEFINRNQTPSGLTFLSRQTLP